MQKRTLVILTLLTTPLLAQTAPKPPTHPDTQLAHELTRLKQTDALAAQRTAAANTPAEHLWQAQLLLAQWDDAAKNKPDLTQQYTAALTAYLKANPTDFDGQWALAHAQFILSKLAQPIITRMEYWGGGGGTGSNGGGVNNAKDRQSLTPLATLADQLLTQAATALDAAMKATEARQPFDEKAYAAAYSAAAESRYYAAWAQYFKAMSIDPNPPIPGPFDRKKILADAAAALADWAVEQPDNGVNAQAFLLRGKIFAESGDFFRAKADFDKAAIPTAPNWVQYQARYQTVVASLRARDFRAAEASLDTFKRWIPKDNLDARLSTDMLAYRVAWAAADERGTDTQKKAARRDALALLASIVDRDPRYRDLVYEQLASQLPENADLAQLLPMQQLAIAYMNSQGNGGGGGQKGDTPESRKQLQLAVDAALLARKNPAASPADKIEAAYLAGACNAILGNLPEAAAYNVEFAELAPKDPRAKPMVELALQQLGELRKIAAAANGALPPDLNTLALRALHLAADTFNDPKWKYAQARMLEDAGKLTEAAAIYDRLPDTDRNFLDARYRLVSLATTHFADLPPKTPDDQVAAAAQNVFKTCTAFAQILDHPPASAPKDVLDRAKTYRYDILIIEAATALHPAVKQPDIALDRLAKLDAAKATLTDAQKGALLRYRIQAYQLAGQPDKALAVVEEYAKSNGQDAMAVIRSMALSTLEQINRVEPTDPDEARRLATYLVKLLDPIIRQSATDKKETAYEYRLIQADMMVRAALYTDAQALANALQAEKPADLRPFLTEARGIFAEAQATNDPKLFAKAQDYFARILQKLTPGSESHWEAWLRIFQSMEARNLPDGPAEIKTRLKDLKALYPTDFGGTQFKPDFTHLAEKYGV